MKKYLKSNWTIYTIGAFGGLISFIKPDYWWVYIIVFGIVVGAIDIYFRKDKKRCKK
tara:strand:+ start:372 stop:542 length:171 start_codon:yes stop_codon:yes gene_type:complete